MLLHCIDAAQENVTETYSTVRDEFGEFDKSLLEKEEVVLLTKIDLIEKYVVDLNVKELKKLNKKVFAISIYDEDSLENLKNIITQVQK